MQKLEEILKNESRFRIKQAKEALFDFEMNGWDEVSTLPLDLRDKLAGKIPWSTVKEKELKISDEDATRKALLELQDGYLIETVLMKNATANFTLCVSTQVGCAMGCKFCSTGALGFKRNLSKEEIIDQYRFWAKYLLGQKNLFEITNIVFMGMGEPFLNYENTRDAIREILEYTKIGQNHIVVSTVGIIEKLNYLLKDELWPNVRVAISLHSAVESTRKKLLPSHQKNFFTELIDWAKKYQTRLGANKRFLSFEYILIKDLNDSKEEAEAFIKFLNSIGGNLKANLILYNASFNRELNPSSREKAVEFQNLVKESGFMCTIRKSYGRDIKGACGQLAGGAN